MYVRTYIKLQPHFDEFTTLTRAEGGITPLPLKDSGVGITPFSSPYVYANVRQNW